MGKKHGSKRGHRSEKDLNHGKINGKNHQKQCQDHNIFFDHILNLIIVLVIFQFICKELEEK